MQTDNQSPQSPALPLLNLSSEQKHVLFAHVSDAVQKIVAIQFSSKNKEDAIFQNIYHTGRLHAFKALLAFDEETLAEQQNQNRAQGNMLLTPAEQAGVPIPEADSATEPQTF